MSEQERRGPPTLTFPLTEFIVALIKMTPAQRRRASAAKAAEKYGLPIGRCQWWIDHYKGVWEDEKR